MNQPARTAVKILIVDDHVILRDGIVSILSAEPDFEVVGQVGSIAAALKMVRQTRPDVVLMDYGLPDGTGLDATRDILAEFPETKIVFLTIHEDDDRLFAAVRSGAKGYLLKNIHASDLLSKLRGLMRGAPPISTEMTSRILTEFARTPPPKTISDQRFDQLTARELEILQYIASGYANLAIAEQLVISVHTVKNHIHNILDKLQVSDRHQAAELARQHGLFANRRP